MRHNRKANAALKDSANYKTSDGDSYDSSLDSLFDAMVQETYESRVLRPPTLPQPIEISVDDPEQ